MLKYINKWRRKYKEFPQYYHDGLHNAFKLPSPEHYEGECLCIPVKGDYTGYWEDAPLQSFKTKQLILVKRIWVNALGEKYLVWDWEDKRTPSTSLPLSNFYYDWI